MASIFLFKGFYFFMKTYEIDKISIEKAKELFLQVRSMKLKLEPQKDFKKFIRLYLTVYYLSPAKFAL